MHQLRASDNQTQHRDPKWISALVSDRRYALIWVPLRVTVGWVWLADGWTKLQDPAWMQSGVALRAAWERAVAAGTGASVPGAWYRAAVQALIDSGSYSWLGGVVAVTQTLVGIALILGLLTGIAALGGSLLQTSLSMGSIAVMSPLLLLMAFALTVAWKTAGWFGLDRWLLPALGAPWESGTVIRRYRLVRDAAPISSKEILR